MMNDKYQQVDFTDFAEIDPSGRYGRYNEILGKGSSKTVFRAFDEYEGIEVAWNQVKLRDFLQSQQDLERLYCEIHLLKTLKHKNIMKFYTSWVDTSNRNINFITEMFTSGTLRQYRQRYRKVNLRAVKHWCRQILMGLSYLHGHDPPVIHRDLKCDNIFINGNHGEVKIGDLGLAAILRKSQAVHCVGTPEFMAPEVYEEEYNELVDIYSFGMCVLEMVTLDYPYSECTHPAQIYKKVISGTKPEALYRVKDPEVRQFVEKCLVPASQRLPAWELLKDQFLQFDSLDPMISYGDITEMGQPSFSPQCCNGSLFINGFSNGPWEELDTVSGLDYTDDELEIREEEHFANVDITIKGRREEDGGVFLRLRIKDKHGHARNIYFPFHVEADTALNVATEMVAELDITDYDVTRIAEMIDAELSNLVPGWKMGTMIGESPKGFQYLEDDDDQMCSSLSVDETISSRKKASDESWDLNVNSRNKQLPSPDHYINFDLKKKDGGRNRRLFWRSSIGGTMKSFHLAKNCSFRVPHEVEAPNFEIALKFDEFFGISRPDRSPEAAVKSFGGNIIVPSLFRTRSLPVDAVDV